MPCLEGCMTLDAMGCHKSIARQIRAQEADYMLRMRANPQGLHDRLEDTFALEQAVDCAGCRHDSADTVGKDHGRIETHRCGDRVTTDTRCFISSLPPPKAKPLPQVCQPWNIENAHHWGLDVAFGEDDSRIRTGHAAHKRLAAAWNKDYLYRLIGLKPKSIWMPLPWAAGLLGCRTATAQTRTQAPPRRHELDNQSLPRFHHRSLDYIGLWKNPAIPLGKRTITAIRDAP